MTSIATATTVVSEHSRKIYRCLFQPESIVVIGASGDELKPGGRVFKSLLENGYQGKLWPVNPKSAEIRGVQAFPSLAQLPGTPDLAIIAIPSPFVLQTVTELAKLGTGATIVLTAGFGEKDDEGKQIEQDMRKIADEAKMALIGPNCSGFLTGSYKGKFAGIVPKLPGGAVDIISGSGATVDYLMECAEPRGLSFGSVVNLGNSVQMGVEDLVQIYDENYGPDNARILMIYMEAVKKPALLLKHARSLVAKGCVLLGIKSGATSAGSRAAASHTGAMATSDTAVAALFAKAGIIRVNSREELIDTACVVHAAKGRLAGKRVCIVTDAGGPGVMLADELSRGGMELPALSAGTILKLQSVLPKESSVQNPIDALPSRTAVQFKDIIDILNGYEANNLDAIAFLTGNSGLSDNSEIYRTIGESMTTSRIPILPMLSSLTSCRDKIAAFTGGGHVFFPYEVSLGRAICQVADWIAPEEPAPLPQGYDKAAIADVLTDVQGALDPAGVAKVLKGAGIALPPQVEVFELADLAEGCQDVGYPLVMKVIGPLHKTDVGGVRVNIASEDAARKVWAELLTIRDAQGVLLQPMVGGQEVILGVSREGDFGHLIMFGLGGIHAEVLKDACFALAPLGEKEAFGLIDGIRSRKLLDGVRGAVGMNVDILADFLVRLSHLVADFPQIGEIDLNPVKGEGDRLFAVDARIIMEEASSR